MGKAGVPLETLRHFSGHTNDRQLLRYLAWGWFHGEMRSKGAKAALVLDRKENGEQL